MTFAGSMKNNVVALLSFGEVVAGNRIPSNPANQSEAGGFVRTDERVRIPRGNSRRPARWVGDAVLTFDRVVRVFGGLHPDLRGSARMAAATTGVHGRERF